MDGFDDRVRRSREKTVDQMRAGNRLRLGAALAPELGPSGNAATAASARSKCNRCKIRASLPLDARRCPCDTPLWKLEASLKCRSCCKGRWAPPVHMIKLAETRKTTPYLWGHPDEER